MFIQQSLFSLAIATVTHFTQQIFSVWPTRKKQCVGVLRFPRQGPDPPEGKLRRRVAAPGLDPRLRLDRLGCADAAHRSIGCFLAQAVLSILLHRCSTVFFYTRLYPQTYFKRYCMFVLSRKKFKRCCATIFVSVFGDPKMICISAGYFIAEPMILTARIFVPFIWRHRVCLQGFLGADTRGPTAPARSTTKPRATTFSLPVCAPHHPTNEIEPWINLVPWISRQKLGDRDVPQWAERTHLDIF